MGDLNARSGQDDESLVKNGSAVSQKKEFPPIGTVGFQKIKQLTLRKYLRKQINIYYYYFKKMTVDIAGLKRFDFSMQRGLVILNGQKETEKSDFTFFGHNGVSFYYLIIAEDHLDWTEYLNMEEYIGGTIFPSLCLCIPMESHLHSKH